MQINIEATVRNALRYAYDLNLQHVGNARSTEDLADALDVAMGSKPGPVNGTAYLLNSLTEGIVIALAEQLVLATKPAQLPPAQAQRLEAEAKTQTPASYWR